MQKTDEKLITLKESFLKGSSLSIAEICESLNIKRARAYDYINALESEGFVFDKKTVNRKTIFSLMSSPKEPALFYPISKKDILKYIVLLTLSDSPLTTEELYISINMNNPDIISKSALFAHVNEMIAEELLISIIKEIKGRNSRVYQKRVLYPSGLKTSLVINMDIEGQTTISSFVAKGQSQSKALHSLYKKLSILSGDNTALSYDDSIFLQYGRGYHVDSSLQKYYSLLLSNHFNTNVISFNYKNKPVKFATGMVVYSQDKDMLYLLGRKIGTHNTSILKVTEISDLQMTCEVNKEYGLLKYDSYLNDMFSISAEKPVDVKLSFKKTSANLIKLKKLCNLRVNGSLTVLDEELIYEDKVSGISDFANYLRSYGYDFKVIKPQSLKDAINTTLSRSLSRYE